MYKYEDEVPPELQEQADAIGKNWADLIYQAKKKEFEMDGFKKSYAEITKKDVSNFKEELKEIYEAYKANGPGSEHVSLEEGVELLNRSKEQNKMFNRRREDLVLAEKLFNLPISKFPELIEMEELNKQYDEIYGIFKEHQNSVKEWSMMQFVKLDSASLIKGADEFEKKVRKLKIPNVDNMPPFHKLKTTVIGFKESVPLIEKLKIPAIQERHWKKIMEEAGKDLGEINLKTITLSKVFELELQNYQDKVDEIINEAVQEENNEKKLQAIESAWKSCVFVVIEYKKGTEVRGYSLKSTEDIKQNLEDNILNLQNIASSKYARAFAGRVKNWEKDLNTISDVIDVWLAVQRKWMYLEAIFKGSEDIRQQLPEEAKKFDKINNAYKKIMEITQKNPNVLQACVKAESGNRLGELKNISNELEKCQKSLSNYLETKRFAFPRFYFISDDDLLSILGSSDPKNIQQHLLKLFDNCKILIFGKGDKQINGMVSDEDERYDLETP